MYIQNNTAGTKIKYTHITHYPKCSLKTTKQIETKFPNAIRLIGFDNINFPPDQQCKLAQSKSETMWIQE